MYLSTFLILLIIYYKVFLSNVNIVSSDNLVFLIENEFTGVFKR